MKATNPVGEPSALLQTAIGTVNDVSGEGDVFGEILFTAEGSPVFIGATAVKN